MNGHGTARHGTAAGRVTSSVVSVNCFKESLRRPARPGPVLSCPAKQVKRLSYQAELREGEWGNRT